MAPCAASWPASYAGGYVVPTAALCKRPPVASYRTGIAKQSALGCGMVLAGLLIIAGLGALGAWLGGMTGFLVGGFLGLAAALGLWVLAFPYVLGAGTSI
jgi:hypothetical protein